MFEGIFQPMHLIIILIIVLIIFGPGKLPELGGSIGKAIKGFKKAMEEPEKKPDEGAETKKIEEPVKKPDETVEAKKMEDKKD
jgi:sec-independent protein translocase protein TatA